MTWPIREITTFLKKGFSKMKTRLFVSWHYKFNRFTSYHTAKIAKGILSELTGIYKNRLDKWIVLRQFLAIKLFVKVMGSFVDALNAHINYNDIGMRQGRFYKLTTSGNHRFKGQ